MDDDRDAVRATGDRLRVRRVRRGRLASVSHGERSGADPDPGSVADSLRPFVEADPEAWDSMGLGELVRECEPPLLWEALGALHHELDADGPDSARELKRRRARLVLLGREVGEACSATAVRAYRDLLRDVSHDIRSPLNSILFLAEGLTSHQSSGLSAAQKRQVGIVYAAAASLLNLVNDLLDFSRTSEQDVGEVASIPFSVPSVMADVKRLIAPLADYHDTDLTVESTVQQPRKGDPQLLCRLLINLGSNAIEAADVGGHVDVRIDDADGEALRVVVADDGGGAEIDVIRKLLTPQPEVHLTRMLHGRTHGLGLVICGRLMRAAGGSVHVQEGEGGGGTKFELLLPFHALEEN